MKIETLNQYRIIVSNINAIQSEIDSYYSPIASPNGNLNVGGGKSVPDAGNPTERAVFKILELKQKREDEQKRLEDIIGEIDLWLEKIIDLEVKGIIRWHFIIGKSWIDTSKELYGFPNRDYCRRKFYAYKYCHPELFE